MGRILAANVFGERMRVGPYGDDLEFWILELGAAGSSDHCMSYAWTTYKTDGKLHWFGSDIDAEANHMVQIGP